MFAAFALALPIRMYDLALGSFGGAGRGFCTWARTSRLTNPYGSAQVPCDLMRLEPQILGLATFGLAVGSLAEPKQRGCGRSRRARAG
jgi:hypothetical protein